MAAGVTKKQRLIKTADHLNISAVAHSPSMPLRSRLIALLLFGSGFCALLYETTWLREFRLVFGASTAASAAVLGVFMAGLGFGGAVLGRMSETRARPLAFYAKLELIIAGTAALSPLLIVVGRHFYVVIGGTDAVGPGMGTVLRLVLTALIIGTPTFAMGGTLPAAVRAAVPFEDVQRRAVGLVYGANTLGAVTGAAVGTFYCFENFGNRLTLWMAAVLNVLIAITALYVSKSREFARGSKLQPEFGKKEHQTQANPAFVFSAAGLVGFSFFLMELVWYRMLGPLLGGSTFSFGLILSVALLGIGLGGTAYVFLGLRHAASLHFFAVTCAAESLLIAIPYALGDRIAMAAMLLRPLGTLGFYGHVVAWTALCLIVVFPAAFVAGVQFPVLIALVGKGRKNVGSQTGFAYAYNTTGALIGCLTGGFGFIPLFSAPGVWRIVTVLLAGLSLIALVLAVRESKAWFRTIAPLISVVLALLMLRATGPTAFWRHGQIGVGRVAQYQGSQNEMRDLANSIRRSIAWQVDGRESSVALAKADSFAFIVNGRTDGNAKGDAGTQIMSGIIGAALHAKAAKAMVVGLGTGSTAGWLADVPNLQRVDVVELEPAVLKVAKDCAPINRDALHNPKLHVTIGDARETLLTTHEKYDIVVSEPSNPYRAGVAGLFTREYYQSVDRCLQPGGMFFQWVQAYDIDDRTMQIFYSTLGSVFPNIESWQTETGDLLLLASHEPVVYDADALRTRLAEEPFKSALSAAWRGNTLEAFLAHYVANRALASALIHLASNPLNTDDRTVIEFAFARSVKLAHGFQIANLRASASGAHIDRPEFINGEVDWALVDEERLSMYPSLCRAGKFQEILSPEQKSRAGAFASYGDGDLPAALRQWREQSQEPKTLAQLQFVSECLASQGDSAALPLIEKLAAALPRDAEAIRAEFLWRDGRPQQATETLESFFRGLREDPWPSRELITRSMERAEAIARSDRSRTAAGLLYNALATPFCVFTNESERLGVLLGIGIYLDEDQPREHALPVLQAFEPHVLWQRNFLKTRKECYLAQHSPLAEQANRDFDEFLKREAVTADVSGLTKEIEASAVPTTDQRGMP
jgi:spermidine synthase